MIAVEISNTKEIMESIFSKPLFDGFEICEAQIAMDFTASFDGHITDNELIPWGRIRPICRSVLMSGGKPKKLKLVFRSPDSGASNIISRYGIDLQPEEIQGMFMNVSFDGAKTTCTTGVSVKDFLKGKAVENAWDERVRAFLKRFE